jgi:hypothetical protein
MFSPAKKNDLLKVIQEHGSNPRQFLLAEIPQEHGLKITFKPAGFHFKVFLINIGKDSQTGESVFRLVCRYSPKPGIVPNPSLEFVSNSLKEWKDVLGFLVVWLELLHVEYGQPDLWQEMESGPEMFAEHAEILDERFSAQEVKQLTQRVAEVEERIGELGLSREAEAAFSQIIRDVPAKAKRLTKKEVADTMIGSLVKEGLKWGLTYEHIASAWHACLSLFEIVSKHLN